MQVECHGRCTLAPFWCVQRRRVCTSISGLRASLLSLEHNGFLGGFIVDYQNTSDQTLLNACLREVHEESSAQPSLSESRVVIVENLEIGWIDVMFMAGVISSSNAQRLKGSKEGDVLAVGFDQLEQQLADNSHAWVSNGIAHHLIWLRLRAPGAPEWFRERSRGIYDRISERLRMQMNDDLSL